MNTGTNYKVVPAILQDTPEKYSADLSQSLQFASYLQVDVADGIWVPHKTVQPDTIAAHPHAIPTEIDLMVQDPIDYINQLSKLAFVDRLIIHVEPITQLQQVIDLCLASGKKCGVAINPETDVDVLQTATGYDQITFMTIHPGSQGQAYLPEVEAKIMQAHEQYPNIAIEVDGGINPQTLPRAKAAGATVFSAGSFIFWDQNPLQRYQELVALATANP